MSVSLFEYGLKKITKRLERIFRNENESILSDFQNIWFWPLWREDKSGSIEKDGPRHQEKQQQQHLQQEGCRYDAALIEELLDGSTDLSDQETKSFTTNPYPNLASLTNTTVNMETNTEGQLSLDKDDGDASIVLESIKLPGKKAGVYIIPAEIISCFLWEWHKGIERYNLGVRMNSGISDSLRFLLSI